MLQSIYHVYLKRILFHLTVIFQSNDWRFSYQLPVFAMCVEDVEIEICQVVLSQLSQSSLVVLKSNQNKLFFLLIKFF